MPLRILFVCWANACRSPMAHALAAGLARERGLDVAVDSAAGVAPSHATAPEAVEAVRSLHPGWESAIDRRRPRGIREVRGDPDVVAVLSRSSLGPVEARFAQSRIVRMFVEDPVGRGQEAYDACARELEERIGELLDDVGAGRRI